MMLQCRYRRDRHLTQSPSKSKIDVRLMLLVKNKFKEATHKTRTNIQHMTRHKRTSKPPGRKSDPIQIRATSGS